MFFNGESNICELCNAPCTTCGANADECLSCTPGLILNGNVCAESCGLLIENDGVCVEFCPDGEFLNAASNSCETCVSPCLTCSTSSQNCDTCISGMFYNYETS